MAPLESREFWVIFDTSTRPEYYQDVHKLLALPMGAVIRYEYRDKYLSKQALRLAIHNAAAPNKVLVIYGQKSGFMRGGGDDEAKAQAKDIQWIGTRFGTMQAVPSTGGANFYFDFSVEGYPKNDQQALNKLLAPLISSSETPFHKWVAISDDLSAYNDLSRGDEEANWEAIVDRISREDMQFRGDSFWRLKPTNLAAQAKLIRQVNAAGDIREVSSQHELSPDDICTFEAISFSPAGRPSSLPSRVLNIQLGKGRALILEGAASLDLRQYTARTIRFRARRLEEIAVATEVVEFRTSSDQTVWPDGPNFALSFQVSQQRAVALTPKESKPVEIAEQHVPTEGNFMPAPEPKPVPVESDNVEGSIPKKTPWFVLQAAIRAVPEVKYGLGVAGLAAAAAIALSFFQSPGAALIGTVIVFVLAILLYLFSRLAQSAKGALLGLVLAWSVTILFILSLCLMASTVFFAYPISYPKFIHQFQPTRRATIGVTVKDKIRGAPIKGAVIILQIPDGSMKGSTDEEGKMSFANVPVGDDPLAAAVSAPGYQDFSGQLTPSDLTRDHVVMLDRSPEVQPPTPGPVKKGQDKTPPPKILTPANLNGTWQIVVSGDINNIRVLNGTFQFKVQKGGEILVNANFVLDEMRVRLSGTATTVGSQVFLTFKATNDTGGTWSGSGNLSMETSSQMSGRIQPKSGNDVSLTLNKIHQ
jgi:hypothetical protein